ncbi:MAG: DUF1194 domain-containing protein [Elioraea sp.]|nr:DUF1194 domain-containing protein [Elioraea sp.]
MRRRSLLMAAVGCAASRAWSREPVDVALVLATDASGSIDDDEFRLQKEGIADAVSDALVLAAIASQPIGRSAVAYLEWGSPGAASVVVPWTKLGGAADAARFGQAVLDAPRSPQSWNAIGDAIVRATELLRDCPFEATRGVIDVAGDGPDMRSVTPAARARDAAVREGYVINALAIVLRPAARGLVDHYAREVIGGPGAFVEVAEGRGDFVSALRRKLLREIA